MNSSSSSSSGQEFAAPSATTTTTAAASPRPPPPSSAPRTGYDVLTALGIKIWYHHKPDERWEYLDLAAVRFIPVPCASLDAFLALGDDGRRVPMSLMAYKQDEKLKHKTPPPNNDRFFRMGYRYLEMTPRMLLRLHDELPLPHRILCLLVQHGQPVHLFADLDDKHQPRRDVVATRAAFVRIVSERHRADFGRDPDWSGTQWYSATTPDKYSEHLHVRSIVFGSVKQLCGWMKDSVLPAIRQRARAGDADALLLGDFIFYENQPTPDWKCIVDDTVWTNARNFRLYGHSKPAGPRLAAVPADGDRGAARPPSEYEYLWRSLITYAITAPRDRWCEWREYVGGGSSGSSRRADGDGATRPRPASTAATGTTPYWVRAPPRIPWFDDRGWPQPAVEGTGMFANNNEWYVRYRKGETPCCRCSGMQGRRVCHDNQSYLTLAPDGRSLRFRSFRSECKSHAEIVPLPTEARREAGSLPPTMRELSTFLASQSFPALRALAAPATMPPPPLERKRDDGGRAPMDTHDEEADADVPVSAPLSGERTSLVDMSHAWVERQHLHVPPPPPPPSRRRSEPRLVDSMTD